MSIVVDENVLGSPAPKDPIDKILLSAQALFNTASALYEAPQTEAAVPEVVASVYWSTASVILMTLVVVVVNAPSLTAIFNV